MNAYQRKLGGVPGGYRYLAEQRAAIDPYVAVRHAYAQVPQGNTWAVGAFGEVQVMTDHSEGGSKDEPHTSDA